MTAPTAKKSAGETYPMVLFEVDADSPEGIRRRWLIVARDGASARDKVPTPFVAAREVSAKGGASGPSRVIGWYGEPLTD